MQKTEMTGSGATADRLWMVLFLTVTPGALALAMFIAWILWPPTPAELEAELKQTQEQLKKVRRQRDEFERVAHKLETQLADVDLTNVTLRDELARKIAEDMPADLNSGQAGPLKVVHWFVRKDMSGMWNEAKGVLQNTGVKPLESVRVRVTGFDTDGTIVDFGTGYADPDDMLPGVEATFDFVMPFDARIVTWNLHCLWRE